MINTTTNMSLPLKYHTQGYNNQVAGDKGLADSIFSFLHAGQQASADWQRDEQHAENAYLRELYSDSTKYQRAVEDAKKAGLNPEMLFSAGGGSTTSVSGGSASTGTSGSSNILKELLKIGVDVGLTLATKDKSTTVRYIFDKKGVKK